MDRLNLLGAANGPWNAIRHHLGGQGVGCCAIGGVNRVSMGAQSFDAACWSGWAGFTAAE